ncbi:MAG: phosphate acyltransferase PlsX [Lactobacillaceae bacterium]|jgi:glycerol-3-phosphate acyltransferase PlsX|nr:phosphate acyltransferase PlsX [Lactobacillaceae bacterium]
MSEKQFTIAVDAMGGDFAPEEIVAGALMARDKYENIKIQLFGQTEKVKPLVTNDQRIEIIEAPEVIEMGEEPVKAIRRKKESSLVLAANAVKEGTADALFSAGNTGALLAASIFIVGRIPGVKRPALLTVLPSIKNPKRPWVLMDVGANAESKPTYLYQFGILADFYSRKMVGVEKPEVKLLNNGAEEDKGDQVHIAAHQLLKNSDLNFQGNIEARELLDGSADVVVADGFSGNAALKSIEGTALNIFGALSDTIKNGGLRTKLGGLLVKPALKKFASVLDYNNAGGAVILGVNAPVVKTHGSAKRLAVSNTIGQIREMLETNIVGEVKAYVENNDATFNPPVGENEE